MRIIVTGGGTGGHVYPALSIIEALKEKDSSIEVLYVGTEKGIESRIVRDAKISFKTLDVYGLNKKLSFDTIKRVFKLLISLIKANKILKDYNPIFVLGTGGYVSFPILYVASKKKIPLFIHEQNAYPGIANRVLSKKTRKLFISFPESVDYFEVEKEKIVISGNPVRNQFNNIDRNQCRKNLGIKETEKVILAFGGSGGARKINEFVLDAAKALITKNEVRLILATGDRYYDDIISRDDLPSNVQVEKYINDMPSVMGACDLIISRAGAITLAEISTIGLPSILLPSPNVANNHQMENAKAFERLNAAIVVKESDYDFEALMKQMVNILDDEKLLKEMKENSYKVLIHNAANIIADEILKQN